MCQNGLSGISKRKKQYKENLESTSQTQPGYVARDIRYLDGFMGSGYAMADRETSLFLTIITLYEKQQYMYGNKTHSVEHLIVSISQP